MTIMTSPLGELIFFRVELVQSSVLFVYFQNIALGFGLLGQTPFPGAMPGNQALMRTIQPRYLQSPQKYWPYSMQTVLCAPEFVSTSLHPKNGLTGAHVRERARQNPSQSVPFEQV
ncbi:MAG: hypothetical protein KUG69_05665 [Marinosulfonomonas sp.]|nr:hypothetical protein [Marinosulfonomonas sp.]